MSLSSASPYPAVVVAKFGGTSVANHAAMVNCARIILTNADVKLVVVSAPSGVTNLLVSLCQPQLDATAREQALSAIAGIVHAIVAELAAPESVTEQIERLLAELVALARDPELAYDPAKRDLMVSFGERFSSVLMAQVLCEQGADAMAFDVCSVLKTDSQFGKAQPLLQATKQCAEQLLRPVLQQHIVVTQGFIGSDHRGRVTTLGRGGSDYSAALLAEALTATRVDIWTDVVGVYSTDPRLCQAAKPIKELSFSEAAEMATFGAKVLHPATIAPASRANIPVFVGSSREPEQGGTLITRNSSDCQRVKAVTLRKEQLLLTLKSPEMLYATGFLAKVFKILSDFNLSVDLITTSEISVALTIDSPANATRVELSEECLAKLAAFCEVKVERGLSLIALVGSKLALGPQLQPNLMKVLADVDIRLICHGASSNNLCFLVNAEVANDVVVRCHQALLE